MGAEDWGLVTLVPLPSRYPAFRQRSSTFICPIYSTCLWHFYFRKRRKHRGVLVTFGNPESWFSAGWGGHMPEAVLCHRRHLTQLWSVRYGDHKAPTPWLSAGRVRCPWELEWNSSSPGLGSTIVYGHGEKLPQKKRKKRKACLMGERQWRRQHMVNLKEKIKYPPHCLKQPIFKNPSNTLRILNFCVSDKWVVQRIIG